MTADQPTRPTDHTDDAMPAPRMSKRSKPRPLGIRLNEAAEMLGVARTTVFAMIKSSGAVWNAANRTAGGRLASFTPPRCRHLLHSGVSHLQPTDSRGSIGTAGPCIKVPSAPRSAPQGTAPSI